MTTIDSGRRLNATTAYTSDMPLMTSPLGEYLGGLRGAGTGTRFASSVVDSLKPLSEPPNSASAPSTTACG
jgi:hypothetical protein